MIKAVFPGTFDPVTNGHMNIIERAAKIVDELTVLLVTNSAKKTMFTVYERQEHLTRLTDGIKNVKVCLWDGLTGQYAVENGINALVRGIRSGTDFDYESQIEQANKNAYPSVETIFLRAAPEYAYLSSAVVKEFLRYGGSVDKMVHLYIKDRLFEKL